jgi:Fur family peroxide stress response transcriptional regulator
VSGGLPPDLFAGEGEQMAGTEPRVATKTADAFAPRFRQHGLPLTVQRRAILEALLRREDHPTAEQIFADVKTRIPEVSRTTVYRVLETLVELGLARKASHLGAAARFDPNTGHHHHLVCLRCDRVVDLEDARLDQLSLPDTRRTGFAISDYSVHFLGLCPQCRREQAEARTPREPARRKRRQ